VTACDAEFALEKRKAFKLHQPSQDVYTVVRSAHLPV